MYISGRKVTGNPQEKENWCNILMLSQKTESTGTPKKLLQFLELRNFHLLNPIPTGHGRNQPKYECHVTTAGIGIGLISTYAIF